MRLTVEDILEGRNTGRRQSVGHMDVIPILGDDDDTFAPPDVEVGTSHYGSVDLRNAADRPTVVPPGAGWVVKQAAQDHAIGSGKLMRAGQSAVVDTAMCIQSSQGGTITQAKHKMLILPAGLRSKALALRHERNYSKLWGDIEEFNAALGATRGGHLEYFLRTFQKELDEFVAQFEVLPGQVGAIVLIDGKVVGVELAPSHEFWMHVWEPLIRVCYGSLAIKAAKVLKDKPPTTRRPLALLEDTLEGVEAALTEAIEQEQALTDEVVKEAAQLALQSRDAVEEQLGSIKLITVANQRLAGQVVEVGEGSGRIKYASLVAPGA